VSLGQDECGRAFAEALLTKQYVPLAESKDIGSASMERIGAHEHVVVSFLEKSRGSLAEPFEET
jgi:hypothetical protein